ncbi:MAG: prepilin-type N-terminal cleavage/methylation domain-containing protein [Atopobiaceae bacterium]|nr:prepilin-type N-terminal cleavage/methylation domain-containing protein [Atopobiaceae bacterium]
MKDYLEKRREELRKRDGGFTLMEMLIVVAIIAVLIAIAIPVFTTQLEKSRDATTVANLRSAYAEASAQYLTNDFTPVTDDDGKETGDRTVTISGVHIESTDDDYSIDEKLPFTIDGDTIAGPTDVNATFTFNVDDDEVSCALTTE